MDTATENQSTGNQQPKRVRISSNDETIPPPSSGRTPSVVTPMARAKLVIQVTLASLSPAIRSLSEQSSF
jgi:N-acetylmuramic acid 6-phosphate (MurNAc-6-P) etherase